MNSRLESLSLRLTQIPLWKFTLGLMFVAIAKTGIQRSEGIPSYLEHTVSIESFNTYYRSSPILLVIAKTPFISSDIGWFVFHLFATGIFVILVAFAFRKLVRELAILLMVFTLLGPPLAVLLTEVGRYDIFFLLGSLAVACCGPWLGAAGAVLMFSSNFEQGLVVLLCLVPLLWTRELNPDRTKILRSLMFGAVVSLTVLWLLIGAQAQHDSRWDALWRNLEGAVLANLRSLPLLIFSWLGVLWLPFISTLIGIQRKTTALAVASAAVLIPAVFSLTTLDGTRVFVCVSFLPLLLVFKNWKMSTWGPNGHTALTLLLLVAIATPALNVYVDGMVKPPYEEIYQFFRR